MKRPDETVARTTARTAGSAAGAEIASDVLASGQRPQLAAGYRLVNRYELLSKLGEGNMGEVWRALDLEAARFEAAEPYVAIKLLKADFSLRKNAAKGLFQEADKAHKVAHENIATAYTFARDEQSGTVFIAMELLDGQPLSNIIMAARDMPIPRKRVLALLGGICAGLEYAHRKGIVHSDLKPANIFVTNEDVPKVLDFGIARTVRAGGTTSAGSADVFQGYTPEYAAPETIRGMDPSPADDIYSLGVVAYELFSGRHPFDGRTAMDAMEAKARPRAIDGLGRREWRALQRALAFERTQRFRSAREFRRALEGQTTITKVLVASLSFVMVVALGLGVNSYVAGLPEIPYAELPNAVRLELDRNLAEGRESLDYMASSGDVTACADAADYFAAAYRLHPRNKDAVAGLETAADAAVSWYEALDDRAVAREGLRTFSAKSEFYEGYGPLQRALRRLGASS